MSGGHTDGSKEGPESVCGWCRTAKREAGVEASELTSMRTSPQCVLAAEAVARHYLTGRWKEDATSRDGGALSMTPAGGAHLCQASRG